MTVRFGKFYPPPQNNIVFSHIRIITKKLCQMFTVITFLGGCPYSQASYYVAEVSEDFIVVAMDSRSTPVMGVGPPSDGYCKITPLSDDVIFFEFGYISKPYVFDAKEMAINTYISSPSNHYFAQMLTIWAGQLLEIYRLLDETVPSLRIYFDGKPWIDGFLGGVNENGKIELDWINISLDPIIGFSVTKNTVQAGYLVHGGHVEIISEFDHGGRTDRARTLLAKISSDGSDRSLAEKSAIKSQAFVEAVRDWSGDVTIGGEVAVLILERGKKWRWFKHPNFCPE